MKQAPSLAKLTKPKSANVLLRKRLFKLLDDARNKPVVWITAPPGAGKTTLISTYLEKKKLPCIWYQVDEGDGDIASFFTTWALRQNKLRLVFANPCQILPQNIFWDCQHLHAIILGNCITECQRVKVSKDQSALTL